MDKICLELYESALMMWKDLENVFVAECERVSAQNSDPSHDLLHVKRVVKTATLLATQEGADLNVVVPAAYWHDVLYVSKKDPRRSQASRLSAERAVSLLKEISYPAQFHSAIAHAIEAHSFSAGIVPQSLEAKIVQDADRLDGVGAIGIARCFGMSGMFLRDFYNAQDPFCEVRTPNDQNNSLDHFFVKLFKTVETLNTPSAQAEGQRRLQFMNAFITQLKHEI